MTDLFARGTPAVVGPIEDEVVDCDVAIIGSGMGGATTASALRASARSLIATKVVARAAEASDSSRGTSVRGRII